jgi:hypothetical protein
MILSHMISDAVLAATGVWVFSTAFGRVSFYSRLLWGFFFLTISLAAFVGVLTFAGLSMLDPLHDSLTVLASSLGVVAVVVATYATVFNQALSPVSFSVSLGVGILLFMALFFPEIAVFTPVVSALGILIVMLLAVLALLQKQHWAVWIVVAVMLMAFATKVHHMALPLHPIDAYHYLIALALLSFGYAMRKREEAR